jgi:hypothetical protein
MTNSVPPSEPVEVIAEPEQSNPSAQSSKYVPMVFPVSFGRLDMARKQRDQTVTLDVCNVCGAVVGNRPAHDVFCYSEEGEDRANYGR